MNKRRTALAGEMPPWLFSAFKRNNIDIITINKSPNLLDGVCSHIDMLAYETYEGTILVSKDVRITEQMFNTGRKFECIDEDLKPDYPNDILLNTAKIGSSIVCKRENTSKKILNDAIKHNKKIINCNQGYSNCSICKITNNAVITEDPSIQKVLNEGMVVLKISSGFIAVENFDYGFIGGASAELNDKEIIFFGNLKKHPDYIIINEFIEMNNKKAISLDSEHELTDIGGIILLN